MTIETVNYLLSQKYIDIVVLDKLEQVALLVEVQGTNLQSARENIQAVSQLQNYLQIVKINNLLESIDDVFIMVADLVKIGIFKYTAQNNSWEQLLVLTTSNIISNYDHNFQSKRIFKPYMETLIEGWLRDLAYHWKSENPPAANELLKIGLLPRLAGGKTYTQVTIGA